MPMSPMLKNCKLVLSKRERHKTFMIFHLCDYMLTINFCIDVVTSSRYRFFLPSFPLLVQFFLTKCKMSEHCKKAIKILYLMPFLPFVRVFFFNFAGFFSRARSGIPRIHRCLTSFDSILSALSLALAVSRQCIHCSVQSRHCFRSSIESGFNSLFVRL